MRQLNFTQRLSELQKPTQKPSNVSERATVLQMFIDHINRDRIGTKYPQIETPKQKQLFAIKMSEKRTGLTTKNLFAFYKECEYQKNFSSYFYWRFKNDNPQAK